MSRRWMRREPTPEDTRTAAGVALGVVGLGVAAGAVAFYLARALVARDEVRPPSGTGREGTGPETRADGEA